MRRCFINFIHRCFANTIIISLLSSRRYVLNCQLWSHHCWLWVTKLAKHRFTLVSIILLILLILLLYINFVMLAIIEELAIKVIICAITFLHLLFWTLIFGSTLVGTIIDIFAILVFIGVVMLTIFSFMQPFCCVVILLASTDRIFDCCSEAVFLVIDC